MKERKEKKEGRNGEVAPIGVSSCPALGLRSRRALSSGQERQVYHEKAEAITKVCYDSQYRATWLSLNPDSNSSGGPHYGEHCTLLWAYWFERMWGKASVLSYLRRIWCEETLNLDLLERIDSLESMQEIIHLYCSSRKRWEFENARKGFIMASRADTAAQAGRNIPTLNDSDELKRLIEAGEMLPIMSVLVAPESGNGYSGVKSEIRNALLIEAQKKRLLNEKQVQAVRRRYASGRFEDEDTVLVMLYADLFEPGMNEYRAIETVVLDEVYLPFPRPYVMDYHTAVGKRRLARWKRETGQRLWFGVDTGKLDYRWAGGCVPLYWRFMAWKRFGAEMDLKKWNEVLLTGEEEREIEGLTWAER